jgi:hypothetical protein
MVWACSHLGTLRKNPGLQIVTDIIIPRYIYNRPFSQIPWQKWIGTQVSAQEKWEPSLVYRWAQNKWTHCHWGKEEAQLQPWMIHLTIPARSYANKACAAENRNICILSDSLWSNHLITIRRILNWSEITINPQHSSLKIIWCKWYACQNTRNWGEWDCWLASKSRILTFTYRTWTGMWHLWQLPSGPSRTG